MRRLVALAVSLVGLSLVPGPCSFAEEKAARVRFPADVPPRNDIRVENLVPVRMRDGVTLYADVYRPAGEGRHPVIVSRTPYSTERFPSAYEAAVYFSQRGYVYVFQDIRGRHESEGRWEPFFDDEKDGYDTIEWAAKQPWSNGKVAMQGGSYLGQNQWRAAQAAPPSLVTIFPMVSSTSLYHDWITLNGGWRLSFNFGWGPGAPGVADHAEPGPSHGQRACAPIHYDQVQWHLPLKTMQQLVGRNARFYDDWLAHPDYDAYWKPLNVEEMFDQIKIPVHTFGGWFDIFSQGTLRGYVGMSQKGGSDQARRMSSIVIGPWGHGPSQKFGALDFGPEANVDANAVQLRWYDYFLKGIDNGLADRAAGEAVRHGPERVGVRARVSAGPHAVQASLLRERRQRQRRSRRRAADAGTSRRAPRLPIASATIPTIPSPRWAATTAAARRRRRARWTSARSRAAATCSSTPRTSCRTRWRSPGR